MDRFESVYKKWAEDTIEAIQKKLSSYPPNTQNPNARGGGLKDSEFIKNITYSVKSGNVYIEYPEYGKWIERGRGKNKRMPPEEPILNWMGRKGINKKWLFPIRRNIGIFGIAPRPFMETIDKQLDDLENRVGDELLKEF